MCLFFVCIKLNYIHSMMPKNCQIVLFSATYPPQVRHFASRFAPNANEFSLKTEELSVKSIKQFYVDCANEEHKIIVLDELYSLLTISQSIIFVQVFFFFLKKVFFQIYKYTILIF